LPDELCRHEGIVRFGEIAVCRVPQIPGVAMRIEQSGGFTFNYYRTDWAARCVVCLRAIAAIVASAAGELLTIVGSRLVLSLLLRLLLIAALSVAVPIPAESAAPLSRTLAATVFRA
jgi:hypothetical protein